MEYLRVKTNFLRRWVTTLTVLTSLFALPLFAQADTDAAQQALADALKNEDVAAVTAALKDGADPNAEISVIGIMVSPLYIAATRGNAEIVSALITAKADPNSTDSNGRSTLVAALLSEHHEVASMLIEAGADVNQPENEPGRGPLMLVIDEAPSLESMNLLLDAGADINLPDKRGETPLAAAAFMGRADAARLLIDRGVDLTVTNLEGIAPIEWARRQGNTEIVEMLTAAGEAG